MMTAEVIVDIGHSEVDKIFEYRAIEGVEEGCRAVIRTNPPQAPVAENVPEYEKFYQIYRGLYPALKDSYKALAAL